MAGAAVGTAYPRIDGAPGERRCDPARPARKAARHRAGDAANPLLAGGGSCGEAADPRGAGGIASGGAARGGKTAVGRRRAATRGTFGRTARFVRRGAQRDSAEDERVVRGSAKRAARADDSTTRLGAAASNDGIAGTRAESAAGTTEGKPDAKFVGDGIAGRENPPTGRDLGACQSGDGTPGAVCIAD